MELKELNNDIYLSYFSTTKDIIVIFDDLTYDIFDFDFLTPQQIKYLEKKLFQYDLERLSGREIKLKKINRILKFQKVKAFKSSIFDGIIFENNETYIYVLTPTQAASYFLTLKDRDKSKKLILELVYKHPINLDKIRISIKKFKDHSDFFETIKDEIVKTQSETITVLKQRGQTYLGKIL